MKWRPQEKETTRVLAGEADETGQGPPPAETAGGEEDEDDYAALSKRFEALKSKK
jgi:hypothetical protein